MIDPTIPKDVRVMQLARQASRWYRSEHRHTLQSLFRTLSELADAVDAMDAEDDAALENMAKDLGGYIL